MKLVDIRRNIFGLYGFNMIYGLKVNWQFIRHWCYQSSILRRPGKFIKCSFSIFIFIFGAFYFHIHIFLWHNFHLEIELFVDKITYSTLFLSNTKLYINTLTAPALLLSNTFNISPQLFNISIKLAKVYTLINLFWGHVPLPP